MSTATQSANSDDHYFLPDFCERWNLLVVMLLSELLAIILAAAETGSFNERLGFLAMNSLFIQWVALIDVAVLCNTRRFLQKLPTPIAASCVFMALQAVTLLLTLAAYEINEWTALSLTLPSNWLSENLFSNLVISSCISAIALRYFYVAHQWKRNVQAEARSRIAELQARIRPHFLFNSMNTIASLTRADPKKAEQAVEDLAEVFRATLADRNQLTLSDEIELAKSYLRIEGLRLGDRLQLEWDIGIDTKTVILPALTLQPLVENAIYHGIENLPQGGKVSIRAYAHTAGTCIQIINPVANSPGIARSTSNKMALENIRQRLRLMFLREDVLQINKEAELFTVTLTIPNVSMSS